MDQLYQLHSPGGRNGIRKVPDKGDNVVNTGVLLEREGAPRSLCILREEEADESGPLYCMLFVVMILTYCWFRVELSLQQKLG